ncbi:MAG: hypothetical protein IIB00_09745 [candidate division Zixibacteria bacterium]|nr:hypothetical protein [candidate division Zixibacteria bacterium]
MNYEIYYFANEHHKRQFDSQPLRYCGLVTDPISHERFYPGEKSPRLLHSNQNYYFTADSNLAVFRAMPSKYAAPQYQMAPEMMDAET